MKENVHFTYKDVPDYSSLCQGDILEVTPELSMVLQEIHPYFTKEQYKYYMVLTQSCDLVRRNSKKCKSPYITLAAVRSFDDFFKKVVISNHYAEVVNDYILLENEKSKLVYQLIERIYNNTEPDYFFLYKEEKLGLYHSMVSYLKVSIALKSDEHYDECLKAKRIELEDEFKAKLGWLVGNIYSRVGTTDWEYLMNSEQKKEMIDTEISSRCIIGHKEQIKQLKKAIQNDDFKSTNEAKDFLNNIKVQSTYDKVLAAIEDAFNTTGKRIDATEKEKILNDIRSRNVIKQLMFKR